MQSYTHCVFDVFLKLWNRYIFSIFFAQKGSDLIRVQSNIEILVAILLYNRLLSEFLERILSRQLILLLRHEFSRTSYVNEYFNKFIIGYDSERIAILGNFWISFRGVCRRARLRYVSRRSAAEYLIARKVRRKVKITNYETSKTVTRLLQPSSFFRRFFEFVKRGGRFRCNVGTCMRSIKEDATHTTVYAQVQRGCHTDREYS